MTIENQADAVLKGHPAKDAWRYYDIPSRSTWDQDARIATAVMGWALPEYPGHQSRGRAKRVKWLDYRGFLRDPEGKVLTVLESLKTIRYGSFFQERMKENFEGAIAFLEENVSNNFEAAIRYYEADGRKKYQRPQPH